ncbi:hypothetical protein ZEAMMB73_Zm00001d008545 [Zea mays]|uniref:Uncharacterized protein n=1 Tax=Zea mays TaxID=4577 RepID=A0A1D6FDV4_MAIZE|nr:hypothetical protein ZEAMMB73_Zm00001d008545 [Zea mays]
MPSCPISDLVVVALIAPVVAGLLLLLLRSLACSSRSMRKGLNGWNKSSSMLRSGEFVAAPSMGFDKKKSALVVAGTGSGSSIPDSSTYGRAVSVEETDGFVLKAVPFL